MKHQLEDKKYLINVVVQMDMLVFLLLLNAKCAFVLVKHVMIKEAIDVILVKMDFKDPNKETIHIDVLVILDILMTELLTVLNAVIVVKIVNIMLIIALHVFQIVKDINLEGHVLVLINIMMMESIRFARVAIILVKLAVVGQIATTVKLVMELKEFMIQILIHVFVMMDIMMMEALIIAYNAIIVAKLVMMGVKMIA